MAERVPCPKLFQSLFLSWCPKTPAGNSVGSWPSIYLVWASDLYSFMAIYSGKCVFLILDAGLNTKHKWPC